MKPISALAPLVLAACAAPVATQFPTPLASVTAPAAADRPSAATNPAESRDAALANRAFGLDLYRKLAAKPGNIFLSPISLAGAFGPVAAGARGDTREAIGRVLRFPTSDAALHPQLGGLLRGLESNAAGARVSIANGLWLMKGSPIDPGFVAVARENYGAEVDSLDFRDGASAAARINAWVERETNNRIRNLIAPDSLDVLTRVVVTNAVHFLGDWVQPFNTARTRPEPFHLAGGTTRLVPMMSSTRHTRFTAADAALLLELPYKGGRLAMVAILPKARGGLAALEANLTDDQLGRWLEQLDTDGEREVLVQLPKVQVDSSYKLNEPLKSMGMAVAFESKRADFRGIIADEQLFISQVLHKTFLRIDERGTEAGAATAVEIQAESSAEPPTFRADHPFLVLIRDKPTGAVLFLGRIAAP